MLEKGIAYTQDPGRQLGPGRPDRARQRAGRSTAAAGAAARSSRSARSPATTWRSRSTPTSCWPTSPTARTRLPGRLARARAADAGALDRQERRRALRVPARRSAVPTAQLIQRRPHVRLHDPRRHDHGRDLLRRRARAPAGRCTPRAAIRRSPRSSRSARPAAPPRPSSRTQEKEGMPTGPRRHAPADGTSRSRSGSATTC